jgi:GPH family glycoside/pentoside/hexuronide:cation symporter
MQSVSDSALLDSASAPRRHNLKMTAAVPDQLSLARKLGFTVGDYACNLYWQSLSIFLLFFYTDVVGLSAATAGLIYMVASIWDGAIDPVMGAIADRTRSRFGRYRPYILFGAVPLALCFALLYYNPPLSGAALVIWLLVTHIIFRTSYTVLSIPFTSLNARITSSSNERATLAGLRMIFATLAGLTIASTTQPLVAKLGGGAADQGFLAAAALFGLLATLIFPLVFLAVREPQFSPAEVSPARMRDYWAAIRANRAFWVVMITVTCAVICATAMGKSLLYYFKYYLHDEASSRLALSLVAASGLVTIPAWMLLNRFIGKRLSWFVATIIGLLGLVFFAVTDIRSPVAMTAFLVYMQIGTLGLMMTFWSMLPDTVEYGEWRSGVRAESFIFGLGQFFLKVALGLGAGLFGVALDLVGYIPNVQQSESTLAGMKYIMLVLPAAGLTLGFIAMLFYPLKRGVHESIVEQLAARKLAAPEALVPENA